jgi:dTDP-4-dehydrorhamnose reductase
MSKEGEKDSNRLADFSRRWLRIRPELLVDKILIFGNGYVGNKFKSRVPEAVITSADITNPEAVRQALTEHKPTVVINCAGKTGKPNVDWCEDHKLETFASNVLGPLVLARECLEKSVFLVHIGSGCVYEGDNNGKGFSEDDAPNFFGSYYSRTKMASEFALKDFPVLQLRLRMPVDSIPGPRNLITKLVQYKCVISIPNSVSIIDDFITAALELIARRRTGVYNVTNSGAIEHKEILDLYRAIVDPKFNYEIMQLSELERVTKARRSNCVLNTDKLAKEGIHVRSVKEAMRATLQEYKKHFIPKL